MKLLLLAAVAVLAIGVPLYAQGVEVSSGVSLLLYQSVFSFEPSVAVETAAGGRLAGSWAWQAGARVAFDPVLPEAFARVLAAPWVGRWRPSVGLELGLTARGRFEEGDALLREMRAASEEDISPFYVAAHAAPLSFRIGDTWRVSVAEIHAGTHLGNTGRTTRAQIGVVSVGVEL